jgi:hypothetical protein
MSKRTLQVIENRIEDGKVGYSMKLPTSPQPGEIVAIRITLASSGWEENCVDEAGRVRLLTHVLEFNSENFSELQHVVAEVRRDDEFTGPYRAYFEHSIDSGYPDSVWGASAVFPSIYIRMADDDLCPLGAALHASGVSNQVQVCQCLEGFYLTNWTDAFCGSARVCRPCVAGMICEDGEALAATMAVASDTVVRRHLQQQQQSDEFRNVKLENVRIASGSFRALAQSITVVPCPKKSGCQGSVSENEVAGDELCQVGYTGPMCQVCIVDENATYVLEGSRCVLCEMQHKSSMIGACVGVACLFLSMLGYILFHYDKKRGTHAKSEEQKAVRSCGNTKKLYQSELFGKMQTRYKIFIRLAQTISKVVVLYPATLPTSFENFYDKLGIFKIFSLDVNLLPFNCLVPTNFHHRLVVVTAVPIGIVIGVLLACAFRRIQLRLWRNVSSVDEQSNAVLAKSLHGIFLFLFSVFPLVSCTILQTFDFDRSLDDGEGYLVADYSIRESDPVHHNYTTYAAMMFCIYCIGIPGVSWYMLYEQKDFIWQLQDTELALIQIKARKEVVSRRKSHVVWEKRDPERVVEENDLEREATLRRQDVDFRVIADMCNVVEGDGDETDVNMEIDILLKRKQNLLKDPILRGLSPLYRDYNAQSWWFEILQFVATFLVASLFPTATRYISDVSIVFLGFVVCTFVLVVLCNWRPYLRHTDDGLAQLGQISLVMILSVALVSLATDDDGSDGDQKGYGDMLIILTVVSVLGPLLLVMVQLWQLAILAWRYTQKNVQHSGKVRGGDNASSGTRGSEALSTIEMTSFPEQAPVSLTNYDFSSDAGSEQQPHDIERRSDDQNDMGISLELELETAEGKPVWC